MNKIANRYNHFLKDRSTMISFTYALFFLLVSLIINYFANQYAYISKSNAVTDILLDNLPVVNMDDAFVAGTIIFIIFIAILILIRPYKIDFILKSMALFIITRSLFVTLTHIGPSPLNTLTTPSEIGRAFTSGADLFFSGHTGMPYLFALMYWHEKRLRYIFLISSVLAGIGVLLGHIHYSIDVASAYFITYGIYVIAEKNFKKEFERFKMNH